MRELFRTSEGVISRGVFRKGALFLLGLCAFLGLLAYGAVKVNHAMAWMTVAVAPFLGLVIFFAICSVVYFWYCLLAKRLRGMAQKPHLLNALLGTLVLAGAAMLADYQNRTLLLASEGLLAQAGNLAVLFGVAAALFFLILLGMGWFGPDEPVAPGSCFPERRGKTGGDAPRKGA
ncbi:MAG: hypothetical protein R3D35_02855 [Nitratireductor sp.]